MSVNVQSNSTANNEAAAVERGWHYVIEPDETDIPEDVKVLTAGDGRRLTIRRHGAVGRVEVEGNEDLPWAALLRVSACIGDLLEAGAENERVRVHVDSGAGTPGWRDDVLCFGATWLGAQSSRHALLIGLSEWLSARPAVVATTEALPAKPTGRVLFFESLMNSDMEHNESEISQGVLHMASALTGLNVDCLFARVKMPIVGDDRPISGLETLGDTLRDGAIGLVCITLLEGYWEGAVKLIEALRAGGCRARIAVGGVMPTLTPEHVAAHLPEVSFVCRGAGEYFLPKLVTIAGDADVDTPLSQAQREAFAGMDGIIALDRQPGRRVLLSGRADQVPKVDDLSRVALDLAYVEARHLVHGLEICTSRGCIHKCTFCNIMGRESYQARSSESVIQLLERYSERFRELFGDNIPGNAYRLHIADDDFACDKPRAAQFFRNIFRTPFRLTSVQVSVADLCRRENGKLLPELDTTLCDAIQPECFVDHYREISPQEHLEDHKQRRWSAYLQIGVETFSNRELVRLGKGYRLEHIRAAVDGMVAKGIHLDAYFIQSNSQTTAEDLLDCVIELVRLKIRHPYHFHVRFPPVPRLVSYFPGATHRRHVRKGMTEVHVLRGEAKAEGYPEYDYPFVDYDEPTDAWVAAAVAGEFFAGEDCYTASLTNLHAIWSAHYDSLPEGDEKRRGGALLRRLDDMPRSLLFGRLNELRQLKREGVTPWLRQQESTTLQIVTQVLGTADKWQVSFQRFVAEGTQRVVLIPTWQCELRCRYCYIPKQDGRVMSLETSFSAIDSLMSSRREEMIVQFFGGEALLEWETVRDTIAYAYEESKKTGLKIRFVVSSNGWSLYEDRVQWMTQYPVKLELSLDGDSETQNRSRGAYKKDADSYANGITPKAEFIQQSGIFHDVIMVVPPEMAPKMADNFKHIAAQGWKRIQINFGLGFMWKQSDITTFAAQLMLVGTFLRERWAQGDTVTLVNLEHKPMPIRLNGEITVDWDGSVHAGNAFLSRGWKADELVLGMLGDNRNFDRLWLDAPDNDVLLDSTYKPEVTANNLEVGKVFASFNRWMLANGVGATEKDERRLISPVL